ncbi:MAG: hypothetical protein HY650_02140, partial [Acidobacteria bacterium]|nr:hypothetical protein [Acidobacteriota bacterium]
MKVLGYNGGLGGYPQKFGAGHDSAAALVVDGQAVAACEEERLNREKHSGKFPRLAIAYCLKEAGVGSIAELDLVTYFYSLPLMFRKEILTQNQEGLTRLEKFSASSILRTMRSYNKLVGYTNERSRLEFERHTVARLGDKKYVVIPHHLCHVASAFYDSPYDSALCVTLDGAGESTCSMVAEAKDTSIKVLREVFVPNSLGLLYGMMTSYLGFQIDSDEYKVMGLAPYGDRGTVRDFFSSILTRRNDGGYQLDQRFILGMAIAHNRLKMRIAMPRDEERVYPPFVLEALGPPRKPGEVITQRHMDIAAALQESLEGAVLHLLEHLRRRTGHRYLCMAGGVALNSTMNGKIARSGLFEGVWVHPAAHDAGTSLGAALFGYHNVLHRPRSVQRQHHCYLGPEYGPHEIDAALAQFSDKITYQRPDDLLPMIARALAEGKVVGWYRGRMEWG